MRTPVESTRPGAAHATDRKSGLRGPSPAGSGRDRLANPLDGGGGLAWGLPADEAVALRPARRLCPVRDVELPVDVRQVELDRLLGHPELPRELRVRPALRDEGQDL